MTITLFDIPSTLPETAWSPNTYKARIALNYKGIPYKTQWVEYPDIEETMKKMGGAPTSKKEDGQDYYTLPAIYDPTTGKTVTDSMNIAVYLEETYPNTPSLFPKDTYAAVELLNHHFKGTVASKLSPLMLPFACKSLNPRSAEFYRRTREQSYGCKVEEVSPPGSVRNEAWARVMEGLDLLAGIYAKNGDGKLYFFGETFSFADVIIAATFAWAKVLLRPENEEWKVLASRNEGRWAELLESVEKDLTVE